LRDISVSFVATGLIQATNIATGLLAARILLPEGRGELAEIMLWAGLIVELGILGLSDALLYRAATNSASPQKLFAAATVLTLILSAILIVAGFVVEPLVIHDSPATLDLALIYLVAFVPIYLSSLFVTTIFQGQLDIVTWNLLRGTVALGYLLLIGVVYVTGHATVAGFAAANLMGMLLSCILGVFLLARRGWIGLRIDAPTLRGLVVYGAKVHVGEMMNSARQKIDQALVALWLPHAELGMYVVALTIANGPLILAQTLGNLAFPKISNQTELGGKTVVFGRYLRFTLAVTVACTAILLPLNPYLVPLLFGQPFAPAATVANIMLLGLPAAGAKILFMNALKAWDKALAIGHAEAVGLAAAAASLVVLLPTLGIVGAAWSLVVANLVAAGVMAVSLQRSLGLPVLALFRPTADDWTLARDLLRRSRA
jgi:O-antigen/teichoic acid export membrane protein